MEFDIAFSNVLLTLMYILPGYLVCKSGKVTARHLPSISAILIYVCAPALVLSTVLQLDYSVETLRYMGEFFVVTFALQALMLGGLYLLLRRRYADARYRVMTIGGVLGNVGFFGLPIIRALLPDHPEVACFSAVFMISMNLFVFTMAIYCLTGDAKYVTLKQAIVNPSSIAFIVAMALYVAHGSEWLPSMLVSYFSAIGSMTTPLCMFILGIRLATVELKKLFTRPLVYGICAIKLLGFPLLAFGLVSLFPFTDAFKASVLILCGTPCASVVLSMAEMYRSEQELSANCVLVSTLLSFITIPLLTLLA